MLCVGCAPTRETADGTDSGVGTGASEEDGADATGSAEGDSATAGDGGEEDTAAGEDGPMLDVVAGDGTGGTGQGCAGIDFLFVIDKSSSMTEKQENLVASFPGFVAAIEEKSAELDADDFHILTTHTDTIGIYNIDQNCMWDCPTDDGVCELDGSQCSFVNDTSCLQTCRDDIENSCDNGKTCHELLPECGACGCTLGGGKVADQDGVGCGVEGGKAYLQNGQSNLTETFACVAEVGISGGNERQADALLNAVSADLNGPGGCNDGFVRDDSILVVTLITDEEDGEVEGNGVPAWAVGSSGTPAEWRAQVVAAKNGDPDAVVMLGLIADRDLPQPVCQCELNDLSCEGGQGEPSPLLREFVTSFPRNVVGSVCEPTYDQFFADAVDLIEQACSDFIPPG